MIAVFCENGQHFAIDDFCPHQGASLAEGYIEKQMRGLSMASLGASVCAMVVGWTARAFASTLFHCASWGMKFKFPPHPRKRET